MREGIKNVRIVCEFLITHWLDLLLVVVGASAFITYILQERRKISEAATLVISQIEDIKKRMEEIDSYIVDGQLNEGAFYESQMLYKTDYWGKYKHYFVKKMDAFSVSTFDEFYNCAEEILEQQQLMKMMQKNMFFLTQSTLMQLESNGIVKYMHDGTEDDWQAFWNDYNKYKENLHVIINSNALSGYTPMQIRITIQNALNKNKHISIIGCDGYRKLKQIALRKW